jgi:hypothetical protein
MAAIRSTLGISTVRNQVIYMCNKSKVCKFNFRSNEEIYIHTIIGSKVSLPSSILKTIAGCGALSGIFLS